MISPLSDSNFNFQLWFLVSPRCSPGCSLRGEVCSLVRELREHALGRQGGCRVCVAACALPRVRRSPSFDLDALPRVVEGVAASPEDEAVTARGSVVEAECKRPDVASLGRAICGKMAHIQLVGCCLLLGPSLLRNQGCPIDSQRGEFYFCSLMTPRWKRGE